MDFRKTIKSAILFLLLSASATTATAQDLLARQAPVDRKLRAVDSIVLRNLILNEQWESPAADLYEDWNNTYAHRATALPDTFKIDLRDFCMPTPSKVITSNFGSRWGRQHKGLDIKVYIGDTIRAAFSGKVRIVGYEAKGYGRYVVIRHHNGLETIYGHMSRQLVKQDQEIKAGTPIGLGGNTGRSTGSHLHFETRLCGVALNPALMFDFRAQDVTGDFYTFRRSSYDRESSQATRLRGVSGSGYNPADVNSPNSPTAGSSQAVASAGVRYHKVSKGETLSSIARRRHTTVNALCKLNRISKTVKLHPGQILKYN